MNKLVVDEEFIDEMSRHAKPDKSLGLLEACRDNIAVFSKHMLGFELRAWQVRACLEIEKKIRGESGAADELALCTSRQIGKTSLLAIVALHAAVFNRKPFGAHNDTRVGIVSASDDQAQMIIKEVRQFIRRGDKHMEERKGVKDFFSDLVDGSSQNNLTMISFEAHDPAVHGEYVLRGSGNGPVIQSFPATSKILGQTFSYLFIDEAGKSERISDEFFYEFAFPTGNVADAVRVYTSTPWQPSGFFYETIRPDESEAADGAKRLVVTIDGIRLEAPELYENVMRIVERMRQQGRNDEVRRAYYCEFVKGDKSYFDPEAVKSKVFYDDLSMQYEAPDGVVCDVGVDFGGQVSSKSVITVSCLDEDENVVKRLFHKSYEVGGDDSLVEDLSDIRSRFRVQRVVVDDCPAGQHMIQRMENRGWDVVRMNFRREKVAKYGAFRAKLQKGQLASYKDDDLLEEMLALEKNPSRQRSRIGPPSGYSDDLIDSWVMSCYNYIEELGSFESLFSQL